MLCGPWRQFRRLITTITITTAMAARLPRALLAARFSEGPWQVRWRQRQS
jgi:hypothetical protein